MSGDVGGKMRKEQRGCMSAMDERVRGTVEERWALNCGRCKELH